MGNRQTGLKGKYSVSRIDGEDKPGGARQHSSYIVLDLTFDGNTKRAAKEMAIDLAHHGPFAIAVKQRQDYIVKRTDNRDAPGGDRAGASYIVLDVYYEVAARKAALTYADTVEADGYGPLAQDIRKMVEINEREYEANTQTQKETPDPDD